MTHVLCRFGIALAASLVATSAFAQVQPPIQKGEPKASTPKTIPQAPSKLPNVGADRTRGLEFLLGALAAAPDAETAKNVENRVWALWTQTSSDTTALLMLRARMAMEAKQMEVARKLLDSVVRLKPDYVEGWNRRATLFYITNDYARSLDDIQEVLKREPRHFGALAGLGMIMQELGDDKRALEAFRKALAIHPHLEKVPEIVKTLTEKVEGRDI